MPAKSPLQLLAQPAVVCFAYLAALVTVPAPVSPALAQDQADPVSAAADTLTLDQVLARHAQAMGGLQRLTAFRNYHARGRIELTGIPGSGVRRSWFECPCRAREEIELAALRITTGIDDGVGWVRDANGRVTLRRDPWAVKEALLGCFLQRYDYLEPGATTIELQGPRLVPVLEGRECVVLRLVEEETELYLDPQTWLLCGRLGTEEGLESISIFDNYRTVQGIKVAFSQETRIPQIGQTLRTSIEEIEFDLFLPDSLFTIPHRQIRDFSFVGQRAAAPVPARLAGGLLYLDVAVGGREPVTFLLDSGAGKTVLDSAYAAELGLEMEAALPGIGAGEVSRVYLVTIPPLRIGGVLLEEQSGAALPLSGWTQWLEGIEIRGVLGFDFLSRFVTRIDYAGGEITFLDPDSLPALERTHPASPDRPGAAQGVRVEPLYPGCDAGRQPTLLDAPLVMNVFTVPVRLDEGEPTTFILDTGAQVTLLARDLAASRGFLELGGTHTAAYGVGGEEQLRMVRLGSLTVADFRVPDPLVAVRLRDGGALQVLLEVVGGASAGILGGNILQRFIVTLDYGRQRVLFERGDWFDGPPEGAED